MTLYTLFKKQCLRELLLQQRQPRQLVYASLFFLMIVIFFPLTMPPETLIMRTIAPGMIWIALLLALLLSSMSLFQQDYEEGFINQWIISGYPLTIIVYAKMLIHVVLNLIPLLLFCPVLAILFHFNTHETFVLMLSLMVGTPTIFFVCGLAAAFSAGVSQKGVLMALILLPLTLPVMILGAGLLTAMLEGIPVMAYLAILLALSLLAISLLPFAIAAVIRISLVD